MECYFSTLFFSLPLVTSVLTVSSPLMVVALGKGDFPLAESSKLPTGALGVKEALVSSMAQLGALIKGSQAVPFFCFFAASSERNGASSHCWPGSKYPLKWLDYIWVKRGALMSNFDVACFLRPYSGLTIGPINLIVAVWKASTPGCAKACSAVLTCSPYCFLRQCSVYFDIKGAFLARSWTSYCNTDV